MRLLVLVVTYNEADNIRRLITEILKHVPSSDVLVVDDNSPDGTGQVVRAMQAEGIRVQLLLRTSDRGYGSAMIAGLRQGIAGGYDVIATLDADFSHDPADLPRLIEALGAADVSVGSRYLGGIRVLNWDVRRLLLSLGANAYVRFLTGVKCVDCTSGFRAYRVSALRNFPAAGRQHRLRVPSRAAVRAGRRANRGGAGVLHRKTRRRIEDAQAGDCRGGNATVD